MNINSNYSVDTNRKKGNKNSILEYRRKGKRKKGGIYMTDLGEWAFQQDNLQIQWTSLSAGLRL